MANREGIPQATLLRPASETDGDRRENTACCPPERVSK